VELPEARRQHGHAEVARRRDAQQPAGLAGQLRDVVFGFRQFGERGSAARIERLPRLGQAQAARRPVQQSRRKPLFQAGHVLAGRSFRDPELIRSLGEAAELGNPDENRNLRLFTHVNNPIPIAQIINRQEPATVSPPSTRRQT
jgi:hypothetical protein